MSLKRNCMSASSRRRRDMISVDDFWIGWSFFISLSLLPYQSLSLELTSLVIPKYGVLHRGVTLECNFFLGNDTLYALKWYKDGHEFFRFNPKPNDQSPIIVFPVLGVSVNVNRSSLHKVHLEQISLNSKGEYKCEISADAPSFKTVFQEEVMRVMVLPHKGPKISGILPWYNIGDNFTANCTVKKSSPEANLTWFLNEHEVESAHCSCVTAEIIDSGKTADGVQFYNSFTQLRFQLDMNYFKDGSLVVECKATFQNTSVILKDVIVSNIKAGLDLQYTDSYSSGSDAPGLGGIMRRKPSMTYLSFLPIIVIGTIVGPVFS